MIKEIAEEYKGVTAISEELYKKYLKNKKGAKWK